MSKNSIASKIIIPLRSQFAQWDYFLIFLYISLIDVIYGRGPAFISLGSANRFAPYPPNRNVWFSPSFYRNGLPHCLVEGFRQCMAVEKQVSGV